MLYRETSRMLQLLEDDLIRHSLWSPHRPSKEAMADTSPFCCESMSFENWLQYVFIPKMRGLIAESQSLPSNIAIAPMAHHIWSAHSERHSLITILNDLDIFLSEPR